jgi:hypothetical protein
MWNPAEKGKRLSHYFWEALSKYCKNIQLGDIVSLSLSTGFALFCPSCQQCRGFFFFFKKCVTENVDSFLTRFTWFGFIWLLPKERNLAEYLIVRVCAIQELHCCCYCCYVVSDVTEGNRNAVHVDSILDRKPSLHWLPYVLIFMFRTVRLIRFCISRRHSKFTRYNVCLEVSVLSCYTECIFYPSEEK